MKIFALPTAALLGAISLSAPASAEDFSDDLRCVGLMSAASSVYKTQSRSRSRGFAAFAADLRVKVTDAMGGRAMNETEKAAYAEGVRAFDFAKLRQMDETARRAYTEQKFSEADQCTRRVSGEPGSQ